MKVTFVLLVSLATILAIAQAQDKVKGDACKDHTECGGGLKCADEICGCKEGHKPLEESHAQGSSNDASQNVWVCKKVVGTGCNHETDCSEHLKNAKCNPTGVCECNKEDNCKDGAMTLTVMSLTTMMAVVVALLKI